MYNSSLLSFIIKRPFILLECLIEANGANCSTSGFVSFVTEVIILTARTSAVEGQIAEFLRKVGAPPLPSKHIIGCEGCNKGEFLYNEVLVN